MNLVNVPDDQQACLGAAFHRASGSVQASCAVVADLEIGITPEMIAAGENCLLDLLYCEATESERRIAVIEVFRAMLRAAPKPHS